MLGNPSKMSGVQSEIQGLQAQTDLYYMPEIILSNIIDHMSMRQKVDFSAVCKYFCALVHKKVKEDYLATGPALPDAYEQVGTFSLKASRTPVGLPEPVFGPSYFKKWDLRRIIMGASKNAENGQEAFIALYLPTFLKTVFVAITDLEKPRMQKEFIKILRYRKLVLDYDCGGVSLDIINHMPNVYKVYGEWEEQTCYKFPQIISLSLLTRQSMIHRDLWANFPCVRKISMCLQYMDLIYLGGLHKMKDLERVFVKNLLNDDLPSRVRLAQSRSKWRGRPKIGLLLIFVGYAFHMGTWQKYFGHMFDEIKMVEWNM